MTKFRLFTPHKVWRLRRPEKRRIYRLYLPRKQTRVLPRLELPPTVTVDALKVVCVRCKCGLNQSFSLVERRGGCLHCGKSIDPTGAIERHFGKEVFKALHKDSFAWSIDPAWKNKSKVHERVDLTTMKVVR